MFFKSCLPGRFCAFSKQQMLGPGVASSSLFRSRRGTTNQLQKHSPGVVANHCEIGRHARRTSRDSDATQSTNRETCVSFIPGGIHGHAVGAIATSRSQQRIYVSDCRCRSWHLLPRVQSWLGLAAGFGLESGAGKRADLLLDGGAGGDPVGGG